MADDKIKKIKTFLDNPEYAIFKELSETSDKLVELDKKLNDVDFDKLGYMKGDKGEKGDFIKGDKGDKGDKGEDGKDGYTPIKGKDYFDGKDGESIKGDKGDKGEDGKDGSSDKPIEIRDKLETLKGSQRLDVSAIKNALTKDDVIKEIKGGKTLEMKDIKGMPLNFNDLRWHGGGITGVNTNKITVSATAPANPELNDLWCDTS